MSAIKLGEKYWCVLKTSIVDETVKDKPEFLVHLATGYVKARGDQLDADGTTVVPFVEMCGQRLKADMVFDDFNDAVKKMNKMIKEITDGINTVQPTA